MLTHSVYSVISPEGCASILWRSSDKISEACQAMKITARELKELEVVDDVIEEPLGGAHHDLNLTANNVKQAVLKQLKALSKLSPAQIRQDRQNKFRKLGAIQE
jgi:acetyl-CoA carboxylase carboxyl transferase subunit alpha